MWQIDVVDCSDMIRLRLVIHPSHLKDRQAGGGDGHPLVTQSVFLFNLL